MAAKQVTGSGAEGSGPAKAGATKRPRRRLLLWIGGFLLLIVVALIALPPLIVPGIVKSKLLAALDKAGYPQSKLAGAGFSWPGSLTLDRFQLLPPYLRRVSHLLKDKAATLSGIINALEAAGAEVKPDDAKQAWLARCPNASAELRAALADGRLMPTLVNHAIRRQMAFNKAVLENAQDVPAKPPDDMKFLGISSPDRHARREPELLQVHQMNCVWMEKPQMGKLNWRGMALFTAKAATRAGVVEAVDIELMPTNKPAPPPFVVAHFSRSIVRALAEYKCEGDHIFEQEFQFVID